MVPGVSSPGLGCHSPPLPIARGRIGTKKACDGRRSALPGGGADSGSAGSLQSLQGTLGRRREGQSQQGTIESAGTVHCGSSYRHQSPIRGGKLKVEGTLSALDDY